MRCPFPFSPDLVCSGVTQVLVIGYGNDLRGDDGVGQRVAETISAQNPPQVTAIAVPQLTPELAELLTTVELAIFVDVYPSDDRQDIQVSRLEPLPTSMLMAHTSDPRSLLALTVAIYGQCPPAWLVAIPGIDFELGDPISPLAESASAIAIQDIDRLIQDFVEVNHA